MLRKMIILATFIFALPLTALAQQGYNQQKDYLSIQEYLHDATDVSAFDEEVIGWFESYHLVDGVLFKGDVLYRYPSKKVEGVYYIPEGVVRIENNAFAGVERGTIDTIYLPTSCIELANSVDDYEWYPMYLGGVRNIIVAAGNPRFSSFDGLLLSKDGKTLLYYPGGREETVFHVPSQIERIDNVACAYNSFSQVVFPDGLRYIGDFAFECNQLEELNFGNNLEYIGSSAFEVTDGIEHITIPGSVKHIDSYAFSQCANLSEIHIEEGVKEIESYESEVTSKR